MSKISNNPKSPPIIEIKKNVKLEHAGALKSTQKSDSINNKESLKIASTKASNVNKKPTLEDGVKNVLNHGVNYFKEVRKKAQEDRAQGVGTLEGANNLWKQLSAQADKFGQMAQDKVIDNFVKEGTTLITDSIKGTQVGDLVSDVLGTSTSSTATQAASGTASSATSSTSAGTTAATSSVASKVVGGIGAAYSLYQIYDTFGKSTPVEGAMNGATVGAYAGSFFGPVGTVVGGAIGAVVGAGLGLINNRKHPERIQRDQMRDALSQMGFIDKDHNIKLADGTNFSISTDGKKKLPNVDGTERYGYQIDFSNPLAAKAIALSQPLAELLTGGHDKLKTDLIGYLANAATSNASSEEQVKANVLAFYKQSGVSQEDLAGGLAKLTEENKISSEEIQVYANDLASIFNSTDAATVDSQSTSDMSETQLAA